MKQFYFFLIALMCVGVGFGQTTQIYSLDFESSGVYTTSVIEFTDGGTDYFTRTDGSNISTAVSFLNKQGSFFFGAQDIDAEGASANQQLTINNISIAGFENLQLRVYLAEDDDGSNQDWDAEDFVIFGIDIDNSGSFSDVLTIGAPTTNTEPRITFINGTSTSSGAFITNTFQQFTSTFSGTGITMNLEINMRLDSGDEDIAIDNIEIWGDPIQSGCTPPTTQANSESFSSIGTNNATINFTRGTGERVLVVMREGTAVDTNPVSGTSYTANSEFGGTGAFELGSGNFVVYDGDLNSNPGTGGDAFSLGVTGLNPNTTYHIAAYEYDITDTCYLIPGLTGNFTTAPAPTVGFDSATSSVNETNSTGNTSIPVTLSNYEAPVTVAVTINPSTTAAVEDYNLNTTELIFNANGTLNISLDINDDADFDDETVVLNIEVISGSAVLDISEHTVTIIDDDTLPAPSLIITEVADPGDEFTGRFVEIYNNGPTAIDLTAEQIHIAIQFNGGSIFSRALSGILQPNDVFIIGNSTNLNTLYGFNADENYGSINGNGDDGYFLYFGGDQTTGFLLDAYGVLEVDGTGEAWEYEDSRAIRNNPKTVSPNATWTASEWTIVSANVADMTPGALENEFRYTGVWKPRDANNNATGLDDLFIFSGSPAVTSNLSVNAIDISLGASLSVNPGASLTVAGNVTNSGTILLNSTSLQYASLINNGTITGNVVYNRYVNQIGTSAGGGNDLVAPPLGGQTFDAFVAANSNLPLNGDNTQAAFAPFNNSTGAYVNFAPTAETPLLAGKGYRVATEAPGGTLAFTGTVATGNVDVNITVPGGTLGKWNLIGNPYPSYINTLAFLQHVVSGTTTNADLLDANARAIYGYNGGEIGIWEIITLANAAVDAPLIAPGQGFFVAAAGDANLQFTPAMRAIGNSDDFIAGRNTTPTYLKLQATNGSATTKTDIYFNENATSALDPGYDAQTWGGQTGGFTLYSHLVAENTGVPMGLQALGMDALNNVSIPLGINAAAGTNLSFSILDAQLPAGTDVYIEDTVNNSVTQINNNAYSINLNQAVNGTGRFFLRFTSGTLSIGDDTAGSLNIYHDAATQHIVIAGQLTDNTTAYLYDLQGRMVSSNTLQASQPEQRVDVSNLSTGVYVLSFDNGTTRISKKLIIK